MVEGILDTFIVEPFVPHDQSDEYYVCINSNRDGEEFLFCHEGGVDVGDVDAKADKLQVLCLARINTPFFVSIAGVVWFLQTGYPWHSIAG